jgi:hypothetical protein
VSMGNIQDPDPSVNTSSHGSHSQLCLASNNYEKLSHTNVILYGSRGTFFLLRERR